MLDEDLADLYGVETKRLFKTLRQLISPPVRRKRPVGFSPPEDDAD